MSYIGGIVGADWWLSIWSSDRPQGNTSADHDVNYYLVGYACFSIGAVVLTFFKSICIALCCLRGAKLLHIRMLRRVIQAPMRFFDTTPIGRVLNRMSSDTAAIDSNLQSKLMVQVPVGVSSCSNTGSIRDDPYWISRENSGNLQPPSVRSIPDSPPWKYVIIEPTS